MPPLRYLSFLLVSTILPLLVSCGTVQPYSPKAMDQAAASLNATGLSVAQRLLLEAKRLHKFAEVATVYRLRAGELAWAVVNSETSSSPDGAVLKILNQAQEGLAETLVDQDGRTQTYSYAGFTYSVSAPPTQQRGMHAVTEFSKVENCTCVDFKLCQKRIVEPGLGQPLAAKWKQPKTGGMDRFVSARGYLQPITSVIGYDRTGAGARQVSLRFVDPTAISKAEANRRQFPLAADFTAPIEQVSRDVKEFSLSLLGMFVPQSQDAELNLLEPYDPQRIPVLLVHGLNSHPRMWRDVYNELRADPALRGKFQFWTYRYPTGWPILYSALRLRQEMAAFDKAVGVPPGVVLIGHSMGGLVSRLQAISPGRAIWDANLGPAAAEKLRTVPADSISKQMSLFSKNADVGRLIFVCVPHRGSKIADWAVVRYLADLVKLPANLIGIATDLSNTMAKGGNINGINRLSPSNPTYAATDRVPIPVPYHSIIGDRGKHDSPHSSDGAVEYWSSHLEGAASELIVPDNHGAYDNPLAIQEMKRVLLLHLQQTGRR
jgi:pimeloyl-ACP methyl ester carboxylesterase